MLTMHPSGSKISPRGVCTDFLSHILVVDVTTKTVIMINQNGRFLRYLLTTSQKIHHIGCLSYDFHTSRLWVGSWKKNKVSVYRYIDLPDALTGKSDWIWFMNQYYFPINTFTIWRINTLNANRWADTLSNYVKCIRNRFLIHQHNKESILDRFNNSMVYWALHNSK